MMPSSLLLPRVAARDDEFRGGFVPAGLLALGVNTPRRHRMPSAPGTAAERMVDRIRVARLHVHVLAGNDHVALREPLRRQDVGKLAVLVLDQRDEAGAVGVVFDALDLGRYVEFTALEVDLTIGLLVATPPVAHGRAAVIVASPRRLLALGQLLYLFAAVEAGAVV